MYVTPKIKSTIGFFPDIPAPCENTPEPYANAYLTGARNCHSRERNQSFSASSTCMCWFVPKVRGSEVCELRSMSGSSKLGGGRGIVGLGSSSWAVEDEKGWHCRDFQAGWINRGAYEDALG